MPASTSSEADELRSLAVSLRHCAISAENAADRGDEKRISLELRRLRRMLSRWHGLRDDNDQDLRMHFVSGIRFYAHVASKTKGVSRARFESYAEAVIDRIRQLSPAAAKRLKVAPVADVIERWSRRSTRDWKALALAWGRSDLHPDNSWRITWDKHVKRTRKP